MNTNTQTGSMPPLTFAKRFIIYFLLYTGPVCAAFIPLVLTHHGRQSFDAGSLTAEAALWAVGMVFAIQNIDFKMSRAYALIPLWWLLTMAITWEWKSLWPNFPYHELLFHGAVATFSTSVILMLFYLAQCLLKAHD